MKTTAKKSALSVLVDLGLASASSPTKNANGKRSLRKQERQLQLEECARSIKAIDVLKHLLETNVITSEQLRAAHASLSEDRGEQTDDKDQPHLNNKKTEGNTNATEQKPDYRTRHIALRVYYEGKDYSGLAENLGQENDDSIERRLFAALLKTRLVQSRESCGYSRCGRTDRGVSAVGQVVALRLKSAIPLDASWDQAGEKLISTDAQQEANLPKRTYDSVTVWVPPKRNRKKNNTTVDVDNANIPVAPRQRKDLCEYAYEKILNRLLPPDIRVLAWCPVSAEFSARFSAADRTYRYFFLGRNLNLQAMKEGLQLLVGTYDFRNLCKINPVEVSNFVRTIHAADLFLCNDAATYSEEEGPRCFFQIRGQAFLWHQIRCIVSVLFLIGKGLESPSVIAELLNIEKFPGKPSYPMAEELPLVLHECAYPNLQLGYSVQNLWKVTCKLEGQWEKLVIEAARVRNCLTVLRDVQTVTHKELVEFGKNRLMERLKKEKRSKFNKNASTMVRIDRWTKALETIESEKETVDISWSDAVTWLGRFDMFPDGNGLVEHIHIPLLQRSKGSSFEEKVEKLQQNTSKRSQKYAQNISKKQKSEGSDSAFYDHMLKQGSN